MSSTTQKDYGITPTYYDPAELEFLKVLEDKYDGILAEFEALQAEDLIPWPEPELFNQVEEETRTLSREEVKKIKGKGWNVYGLYAFGGKNVENCARCPVTMEALSHLPHVTTAAFSLLEPGSHITPHTGYDGYSNFVLRTHLGIIIPDDIWSEEQGTDKAEIERGLDDEDELPSFETDPFFKSSIRSRSKYVHRDEAGVTDYSEFNSEYYPQLHINMNSEEEINMEELEEKHKEMAKEVRPENIEQVGLPFCGLRVGRDVSTWQAGKVFVFDDSHSHEAWNFTNKPRVVLLIDFARPNKFLYGDDREEDDGDDETINNPFAKKRKGRKYLDQLVEGYGYSLEQGKDGAQ